MSSANWFEEAFRDDYRQVYPHRDLAAARPEVAWLVEHGVRGTTLDLCCGFGRHTLLLREAGVDAFGIDLSLDLLQAARRLPDAERELAGRLLRGDARELPLASSRCDSVVNLFSSFGYFGELGDARVLSEIARVLRPGGLAVLDLMNPDFVRANLRSETTREDQDILLRERRSLVDAGRRVIKDVELVRHGVSRRWREDVRLYELDELRPMFAANGLSMREVFGGFGSEPFGPRAPRMLVTLLRQRGRE